MIDTSAAIRFYRATGEYGWLSNLWPAPIALEYPGGLRYFPTVEHAYQFEKFVDRDQAIIAMALHPSYLAVLAHGLLPWQVVPDWKERKVPRMAECLRAKFGQHPALAHKLLATDPARLIEQSKTDAFWGEGRTGTGRNMLGELLMETRGGLRT